MEKRMKVLTGICALSALLVAPLAASIRSKRAFKPVFASGENLSFANCGESISDKNTAEKYPWLVKIYAGSPKSARPCFGAVISDKAIITSAFCFQGTDDDAKVDSVNVVFAKNFHSEILLKPSQIVNHKDYDYQSLKDNIAILKFKDNILDNGVRPLCLWNQELEEASGMIKSTPQGVAEIIGKPRIRNATSSNDEFVFNKYKIFPKEDCKDLIHQANQKFFDGGNICMTYIDESGVCGGNGFGSPMQFKINGRWYLRGIYNIALKTNSRFKELRCNRTHVISFTDTARFVQFIVRNSNIQLQNSPSDTSLKHTNPFSFSGCGKINKADVNPLIIGGQVSQIEEFPWQAALFLTGARGLSYICGGALISSHFVLTAAHCVYDEQNVQRNTNSVVLYFGKTSISTGWNGDRSVQSSEVQNFYAPTNYKVKDLEDIALIHLTSKIRITQSVVPICIWSGKSAINELYGKNGSVTGWGISNNKNKDSVKNQLESVTIPIVDSQECRRIVIPQNTRFYQQRLQGPRFCAGGEGFSPCNGDSGSAFVVKSDGRYFIRGIVSESPSIKDGDQSICNSNYPALFTDVVSFRDWILNTTDGEIQYDVQT